MYSLPYIKVIKRHVKIAWTGFKLNNERGFAFLLRADSANQSCGGGPLMLKNKSDVMCSTMSLERISKQTRLICEKNKIINFLTD